MSSRINNFNQLMSRTAITAAEVEDILQLLPRLKVLELKEVCKCIGLTLKGKKQELVSRIEQRVRSMHVAGDNVRLLAIRYVVLKLMHNNPAPDFATIVRAIQSGHVDFNQFANLLTQFQQNSATDTRNRQLNGSHGLPVARSSSEMLPPSSQLHPMLLFQSTIFYTLRKMVRGFPRILDPSKGRNVFNLTCQLYPDEIQLLRLSAHTKLFLFSGLSSTKDVNNTDIQFPPIEIHVDGVHTKQYVKGLKGKAGTCRPADLTPYLRNLDKPFNMTIVYSDAAEAYVLYLYIVTTRSPDELLQSIEFQKPHIPASATREEIRQDYQMNQDDDIVMATSSISLRCPITYARMSHPTKSTMCDHIQCFDGLSFLTMQERIPLWICPVCSKKISQQLLAISDYIRDILNATTEDVDTVTLNPDGSWTSVMEEGNDHLDGEMPKYNAPREQSAADESIEIISLGSESGDEEPHQLQRDPEPISTLEAELFRELELQEEHTVALSTANPLAEQKLESLPEADASGTNSRVSLPGADASSNSISKDSLPEAHASSTSINDPSTAAASSANIPLDSLSSDDEPLSTYGRRQHLIVDDTADEFYLLPDQQPLLLTSFNDTTATYATPRRSSLVTARANANNDDNTATYDGQGGPLDGASEIDFHIPLADSTLNNSHTGSVPDGSRSIPVQKNNEVSRHAGDGPPLPKKSRVLSRDVSIISTIQEQFSRSVSPIANGAVGNQRESGTGQAAHSQVSTNGGIVSDSRKRDLDGPSASSTRAPNGAGEVEGLGAVGFSSSSPHPETGIAVTPLKRRPEIAPRSDVPQDTQNSHPRTSAPSLPSQTGANFAEIARTPSNHGFPHGQIRSEAPHAVSRYVPNGPMQGPEPPSESRPDIYNDYVEQMPSIVRFNSYGHETRTGAQDSRNRYLSMVRDASQRISDYNNVHNNNFGNPNLNWGKTASSPNVLRIHHNVKRTNLVRNTAFDGKLSQGNGLQSAEHHGARPQPVTITAGVNVPYMPPHPPTTFAPPTESARPGNGNWRPPNIGFQTNGRPEQRPMMVPQAGSHSQNERTANSNGNGDRYSRSAFDLDIEDETPRIRGLLGIELSKNALQSVQFRPQDQASVASVEQSARRASLNGADSRSQGRRASLNGADNRSQGPRRASLNGADSRSQGPRRASLNGADGSSSFEQLQASLNASDSRPIQTHNARPETLSQTTPIGSKIQEMSIQTPAKKRVGSILSEDRTWNKKLSNATKAKFDPTKIHSSQIIELDE